jgi:NADP-dependent aldehyde dehydrogenase
MSTRPLWLGSGWRAIAAKETVQAMNPTTGAALEDRFPVSGWAEMDEALTHAADAAPALREASPKLLAELLNNYAAAIEKSADALAEIAHQETALPIAPRLKTVEIPRTTAQLRQAATAAVDGSWALPTIDTKNNIRSAHAPLGPVLVIGPNNFPFAFNAISGGDFAAALAAGNPVIAKGHPSHPGTTARLAELLMPIVESSGLPAGAVQLLYHMPPDVGLRAVADPRLASVAFTGSRKAGLALKAAADAAGKPAYLEMSSLNPLVILPAAIAERSAKIADEYADSALAANGQFCTNPGLVFMLAGDVTEQFIAAVRERFDARASSALLSKHVLGGLTQNVESLRHAGAKILTGGAAIEASCSFKNTLLRVDGDAFVKNPHPFQTEAFGNAALFVVAKDLQQLTQMLKSLEGQLTGCIYSDTTGKDEHAYQQIALLLRRKVGRLLNDKMPTGVALSPAMNHGGPYPATGHPAFTAVGIPASMRRFSQLECYDNVRDARLPALLQNQNHFKAWRMVDGKCTQEDLA